MSTARTSSLFHFTRALETLQNILSVGFWPRLALEDHSWIAGTHWAFPMVCFCDIPIGRLTSHLEYYGSYGIGMSQEWAMRSGLTPVVYINPEAPFAYALHSLAMQKKNKSKKDRAAFFYTLAHTKQISGKVKKSSKEEVERVFYEECEWRYVPPIGPDGPDWPIEEKAFRKPKVVDPINALHATHCTLQFKPDDVRYILVSRELEIPHMYDYIDHELGHHSADSLKVLTTKIISVERLLRDV